MALQTAVGLAFDIVGAILIAVPDTSFLSHRFDSGQLAEARERMVLAGGARRGDPGFQKLVDVLRDVEAVALHGKQNGGSTYEEIVVKERVGYAARGADFHWGDEYIEARYEEDADWEKTDFFEVDDVYDATRPLVESQMSRIRFGGLVILSFGFLIQLVANLGAPNSVVLVTFCFALVAVALNML